ncbi:MAG: hypothetical protein EOS70_23350 [Mesorhizobium sp.]|uniref:hypothetical protein n=1 Tax=Mesorhizobium sp. TaxID=1871066 RepID=UPI000FE5FAF4|nr:hypothetical protein [Mesorhizobium sp.]RWC29827.1 MAG: hypothetical protein EOS70_23350 [Mesorhizobium sp.]
MTNSDEERETAAYEREDNWLSLAVAGAIVSLGAAGFLAWWVLSVNGDVERLQRVQTVSPLGVLAVAGITFATVVWRGLISVRQANTSIQQLDGLRRQIALTEESGLATLLQKGAELIADDKQAMRSAGIATLEAVASADSPKFADPSRRLLLDFIAQRGSKSHGSSVVRQAVRALNASFRKNSIYLHEAAYFEMDDELDAMNDDYVTDWLILDGISRIQYRGGVMKDQRLLRKNIATAEFYHVELRRCQIEFLDMAYFNKCKFVDCTFGRVHVSELVNYEFEDCDFSNTEIYFDESMPDMRKTGSFYLDNSPPAAIGNTGQRVDWEDVFLVVDEVGTSNDD